MRWVKSNSKKLLIHEKVDELVQWPSEGFEESITNHAVHELLFHSTPGNVLPLFPALLAARTAMAKDDALVSFRRPRKLMWIDSIGTFYPPAVIGSEISLDQICVLRPQPADLIWATIESLRCRSNGAVVASITQPLTRVDVRRMQLAAEMGGGVAVLIRPHLASAASHIYAAATRWLVTPEPGQRTLQRWRLELIHGHGRRIGQSFVLEKHRASGQTNFVHLPAPLVHHPAISAAS